MHRILVPIKTDTFAFSDLFNYIWQRTRDEIENDVKDQKLLGSLKSQVVAIRNAVLKLCLAFHLSIVGNLFSKHHGEKSKLCEQFIESPDFPLLIQAIKISSKKEDSIALFPAMACLRYSRNNRSEPLISKYLFGANLYRGENGHVEILGSNPLL